jgi:hypothetical protein
MVTVLIINKIVIQYLLIDTMLYPENASRSPEYAAQLADAVRRGECLLDPGAYFASTPPEDVLAYGGGWVLGRAKYPYVNTEQGVAGVVGHMLLFPERHIVTPDEMTDAEQHVYWEMLKVARDDFGAATGAVVMRYSTEGKQVAVGASIDHLHAHILVPHLDEETGRVPGFGTSAAQVVTVSIG